MTYILGYVRPDGTIRTTIDGGWGDVVHRQTVALDKLEGIKVFNNLDIAKSEREKTDNETILTLDENGGVKEVWMQEKQKDKLVPLISVWKGCYGLWPIKTLND